MYLLGYDLGSSSIKVALIDANTREKVAFSQYPAQEMDIHVPHPGWAEQDPKTWWDYLCQATHQILANSGVDKHMIKGIGISYQMHGLVLIDRQGEVLRPAIIWCDSRAVEIGEKASQALGPDYCLKNLLNSPGNFTASKLRWVKLHEPHIFEKIHHILLPGDYIAFRMTGEAATTISGLSEGIFWDFSTDELSHILLEYYGVPRAFIPPIVPTFSQQGSLTASAAQSLGLPPGIPICYRAGDQPNNALTLGVLHPGEVAATAGTSGVVYGVVDRPAFDPQSRVNGFAHVNYTAENPRIGILLCINGSGIQYSWLKHTVAGNAAGYDDMESAASGIPIGADGLSILPFGNGAERMLNNKLLHAQISGLDFNRHTQAHLYRAALEGVAFAFVYGMKIMEEMGLSLKKMKVGNDNMFRSKIFGNTLSTLTHSDIQVIDSTGAIGAAKAAGVAAGIYPSIEDAVQGIQPVAAYEPTHTNFTALEAAYLLWLDRLNRCHA